MSILSSTAVVVLHMSKNLRPVVKRPLPNCGLLLFLAATAVYKRRDCGHLFCWLFLASSLTTACQFLFLSTVCLVRGTWRMINSSPSSNSFTLVMCGTLINLVLVKFCLPNAAMCTELNVLVTISQLKDGSLNFAPDCFIFWVS